MHEAIYVSLESFASWVPEKEEGQIDKPWIVEGDFGYLGSFANRDEAVNYAKEEAKRNNATYLGVNE